MNEDIRKMIDKVKNFKQFVNENIGVNIKSGVNLLYQQYPELSNIGTQEQYSQYIDTIFPNSKIKNILYHSSPNKIEKFRDNLFGTYFSYSPIQGTYGNVIYCVLLNINNPLIKPKPEDNSEVKEIYNKEYRNYNNPSSFSPEGIRTYKYDASIESSTVTKEGVQIRVRTPEQIHILGSKQDIEGFKNFIKK
jgi:hypothetical protein